MTSIGTINSKGVRPEDLRTISDFADYFEAIPDEKWAEGFYRCDGRRCGRGHLGTTGSCNHPDASEPDMVLAKLLAAHGDDICMISNVNDGYMAQQLPTPRLRVVAYLRDLASKGSK
jgi:hypothetical protein